MYTNLAIIYEQQPDCAKANRTRDCHHCMKHLFGPVNSRRLGRSQGIDLLPPKTCNFNCIYCEINKAPQFSCERGEHVPTRTILAEIDGLLEDMERVKDLDVFTITASGEPTLHSGIGRVIRHIKEKTDKPVAILTNASQMHLEKVRQDLMAADIVIPSLDSARPESFRRVNRPAQCTPELATIIRGIAKFSREFTGKIWLEILLVENINDSAEDIMALRKAIKRINPTRVQLNTVARPPYESYANPLSDARMLEIKGEIAKGYKGPIDILAGGGIGSRSEAGKGKKEELPSASSTWDEEAIMEMLCRRPGTAADIAAALDLEPVRTADILADMEKRGSLAVTVHGGQKYFRPPAEEKQKI